MKGILSVILIAGLLALAGCSGTPAEDTTSTSSSPSTVSQSSSTVDQSTTTSQESAQPVSEIQGFKSGIHFGMSREDLAAVEPDMVQDTSAEGEIWCAFETVSGTPVYDLAVRKGVDLTNCYTFVSDQLASVEAYIESNEVRNDDYLALSDEYSEIFGVKAQTTVETVGPTAYQTSVFQNGQTKLTLSLVSDIPDQLNYLSLIFEPAAS